MENLVLHRFQVRSKSLKYFNTSKEEKNSASALLTAVVNVRRQTLQQTSEAVVQQVRFLILAGTTKSTWSKSLFENLILFTNHFFNPTPSLQNTSCYKFSRTICRDFHYERQKTPVVPINVNLNAFLVNNIAFKTANWLETHCLVKYICTYKKLFSTCNCQKGLNLPTSDSTCAATMLRNIAKIRI
jgi:hypothetical protein